jgi:hypothetical protein
MGPPGFFTPETYATLACAARLAAAKFIDDEAVGGVDNRLPKFIFWKANPN